MHVKILAGIIYIIAIMRTWSVKKKIISLTITLFGSLVVIQFINRFLNYFTIKCIIDEMIYKSNSSSLSHSLLDTSLSSSSSSSSSSSNHNYSQIQDFLQNKRCDCWKIAIYSQRPRYNSGLNQNEKNIYHCVAERLRFLSCKNVYFISL